MTVDLSKLKVGDTVKLRDWSSGSNIVKKIERFEYCYTVTYEDETFCHNLEDGKVVGFPNLDIVEIIPKESGLALKKFNE